MPNHQTFTAEQAAQKNTLTTWNFNRYFTAEQAAQKYPSCNG